VEGTCESGVPMELRPQAAGVETGRIADAGPTGPRPGTTRRVVRGRRVRVEMLGADGAWSPLFCYDEPPAGCRDDPRGGPEDLR